MQLIGNAEKLLHLRDNCMRTPYISLVSSTLPGAHSPTVLRTRLTWRHETAFFCTL